MLQNLKGGGGGGRGGGGHPSVLIVLNWVLDIFDFFSRKNRNFLRNTIKLARKG